MTSAEEMQGKVLQYMKEMNTEFDKITTFGDKVADKVTDFTGTWKFVSIMSFFFIAWITGNVVMIFHFDPFPFILLNLGMSTMATYATPIILMSDRRKAQRDEFRDYKTSLQVQTLYEKLDDFMEMFREEREINEEVKKIDSEIQTLLSKETEIK